MGFPPGLRRTIWRRALARSPRAVWYHTRKARRLPHLVEPASFADKMLWRKVFDRDPLHVAMTDKLAARDVARERLPDVQIPDLLWIGEHIDDLPFPDLVPPYIVKMTDGSGWYELVRDRTPGTVARVQARFRNLHRKPPYGWRRGEWAYGEFPRRVFAERLLLDAEGRPPDDHKLYVCAGEMVHMHVTHDRWGSMALTHFDNSMNLIPDVEPHHRTDHVPANLDMLDDVVAAGRALAGDMDFVRVDLYLHQRSVWFGEFTIYPTGGFLPWKPELLDRLASHWDIRKSWYLRSGDPFASRYLSALDEAGEEP